MISRAFVHHHVGFIANVEEIEIALGHFVVGGVGDKLAVHAGYPHCAQRAIPRDVTDGQRCGCAEDAQHIRLILTVSTEQQAVHLALIEPALFEERSNGAVGKAHSENLLVTRAAFPSKVVAGDLTTGRGSFPIVYLQREKVSSLTALGVGDNGRHHDRLAHLDRYGPI